MLTENVSDIWEYNQNTCENPKGEENEQGHEECARL